MNAIALSCIALFCVLGGDLFGMVLRNVLPGHHLNPDAKDVVRLGSGLIGTISALVLGLLIASAKSSFDAQSSQVRQLTASIILLDQQLAQYGSETNAARELMRRQTKALADLIWKEGPLRVSKAEPFEFSGAGQAMNLILVAKD